MDSSLWHILYGCGLFVICLGQNQSYDYGINAYSSLPRLRRQTCRNSEFNCRSGECIDNTAVCDGAKDCNDGSDETANQCRNVRCPPFAFQCNYGGCVDGRAKCNGVADCVDDSDEKHPSCTKQPVNTVCKSDEFLCKSGKCIDSTVLCDGLKDCDDSSDETFERCSRFRCSPLSFRCAYGACIDSSHRCDGRPHCVDSSDEDPSLCGTTEPPKPGCRLPTKPNHGSFKVLNCVPGNNSPLCQKIAGTVVPDFTLLEFQCDSGYTLAGRSQNSCVGGKWANSHPTCVAVSCPELDSVSVRIKCNLNGNKVPCDKPMAPGTEAHLTCNVAYHLINEPGYDRIFCQENGNWDRPVFTCVQECGKRNPKGKPAVSNGVESKVGEFPWHVGIYRYEETGEIMQICGGSLINPDTVLTAAHCFWNEKSGKAMDKSDYKVAAGKYHRDWDVEDDEIQKRELKDLIVHEDFRGRQGRFQSDIAILKLNVSIELTWAVLPVCLDLNSDYERFQLITGNSGSIVGWGITEKNEASHILITAQLPYVSFNICWDTVPPGFRAYLTKDKFCAGFTNGTSVCPGDSGGGLAFEYEDKFYLRGIVSIGVEPEAGQKCFINQYTAFTKVSDYLPWIRPYIR